MTKKLTVEERIIRSINSCPGLTTSELTTGIQVDIYDEGGEITGEQLLDTINKLSVSKKIVELEYILPTCPTRIKCRYFPEGTAFLFSNTKPTKKHKKI